MTDTEGRDIIGRASCRKMQQPRHARMRAARQGRQIATRHRRWVGRRRPQTTFLSLAACLPCRLTERLWSKGVDINGKSRSSDSIR